MENEDSLLGQLIVDIDSCDKNKIVLFAGHFPLVYGQEPLEDLHIWGEFSTYSLELACKVGEHAKRISKDVEFVFFVDDHIYEDCDNLSYSQVTGERHRLYRKRSGPEAQLPQEYKEIMQQHSFYESDVLRHDHGKFKRKKCLYFAEKILRATGRNIDNACAREYVNFLEDPKYFDRRGSHLVSFIPQRCRGNICDVALDLEIEGLSASHVFMETMAPWLTREQLYSFGRGVTYRRD